MKHLILLAAVVLVCLPATADRKYSFSGTNYGWDDTELSIQSASSYGRQFYLLDHKLDCMRQRHRISLLIVGI